MSFTDTNDYNCSPTHETIEDKIKQLLTTIFAEETNLADEIRSATKRIQSASQLLSEQCETDPASTIITLIRHNTDIEHELKNSIKKEMEFQLELEKLLDSIPVSSKTTESNIHNAESCKATKSST